MNDPLVPIRPEFLQAAIDASTWNIKALADHLGELSQTLDHLLKPNRGRPRQCRAGRRAKLAEALRVPELWLAGLEEELAGFGHLSRERVAQLTPRAMLAAGRLFEGIRGAVRRDSQDARVRAALRRFSISEADLEQSFYHRVFRFLSPDTWRTQLTTWRPAPDQGPPVTRVTAYLDPNEPGNPTQEAAVLGLVAVLEYALAGWLRGEDRLDYRRLRQMIGYTVEGPDNYSPLYLGEARSPLDIFPNISYELNQHGATGADHAS